MRIPSLIRHCVLLAAVPAALVAPGFSDTLASPAGTDTASVSEVPMYRAYNPNSGEHHYTASWVEYSDIVGKGWNPEGWAWVSPSTSDEPVYRLYNPYAGDHHYTTSAYERDYLKRVGWNDEGIGWYSAPNNAVKILRAYNPNASTATHHYTASKYEVDSIVAKGWRDEGVGWYALKGGDDSSLPAPGVPEGPKFHWMNCVNRSLSGTVSYHASNGWTLAAAQADAAARGATDCIVS